MQDNRRRYQPVRRSNVLGRLGFFACLLAFAPPAIATEMEPDASLPIPAMPAAVERLVNRLAPAYGLDPQFVAAVMAVESGFDATLVSEKDARGLMQLIPETAARFDVADPFDPEQNLRGGMKYLRWLLAFFDGSVTLALAGYNAGEGAVLKHGGVPPYGETRRFIRRVRSFYAPARHPFNRSVSVSSGLASAKPEVAELPTAEDQANRSSIED